MNPINCTCYKLWLYTFPPGDTAASSVISQHDTFENQVFARLAKCFNPTVSAAVESAGVGDEPAVGSLRGGSALVPFR